MAKWPPDMPKVVDLFQGILPFHPAKSGHAALHARAITRWKKIPNGSRLMRSSSWMNVDIVNRIYFWSARRSPAQMLAGTFHGLIPCAWRFLLQGDRK